VSPIIRAATLEDAETLAHIHRECFDEPWDTESFRRLLDRRGAFALLGKTAAATDSQAFILMQVAADESEILSLATLPDARRLALARALLIEAAREARRRGARGMFLDVAEDNQAALPLYRNLGFALRGRRRSYYARAGASAADGLMLRAALPLKSHGNRPRSRLD
jgi:ribosomal-protein-alanine N-acetyltransferase